MRAADATNLLNEHFIDNARFYGAGAGALAGGTAGYVLGDEDGGFNGKVPMALAAGVTGAGLGLVPELFTMGQQVYPTRNATSAPAPVSSTVNNANGFSDIPNYPNDLRDLDLNHPEHIEALEDFIYSPRGATRETFANNLLNHPIAQDRPDYNQLKNVVTNIINTYHANDGLDNIYVPAITYSNPNHPNMNVSVDENLINDFREGLNPITRIAQTNVVTVPSSIMQPVVQSNAPAHIENYEQYLQPINPDEKIADLIANNRMARELHADAILTHPNSLASPNYEQLKEQVVNEVNDAHSLEHWENYGHLASSPIRTYLPPDHPMRL